MAGEFLSVRETAVYGRFDGAPPRADLERAFFLDDADRALIGKRRGDHSKLGFALQLTTVRYLGLFLADPLDVPVEVVDYVAGQLDIGDPSCVKRYTGRPTMIREGSLVQVTERGGGVSEGSEGVAGRVFG